MMVVDHASTDSFLACAQPWLLRAEAEHNLVLGLALDLRGRPLGEALFATVEEEGRVAGCAFRTPPHKLGLTRMPAQAIAPLVDAVHRRYPGLDRVLGPSEVAAAFACEWCERFGGTPRMGMGQLIYQLDRIVLPEPMAAGELRVAAIEDLPLIVRWLEAFGTETAHPAHQTEAAARTRISAGDIVLWVDEGRPRCMAGRAARTPKGARVGYVYTPPADRGHGYASACVAAFSARLLADGCTFCTLYTDAANPTSNSIYLRMGYRPIAECADWLLREPTENTGAAA